MQSRPALLRAVTASARTRSARLSSVSSIIRPGQARCYRREEYNEGGGSWGEEGRVRRSLRRRLVNPPPPPEKRHSTKLPDTAVPQLSEAELQSVFSQELFVFRCDISASQIASAMAAYPRLKEIEVLLTSNDISNLARQLHNRYRFDRDAGAILPHIQTLINDLKARTIPGHPLASVHILSALKDMSEFDLANSFWQWLREQDEEHTDARVYGAMIETLAYQGEPLGSLERVYEEAFDRYHTTAKASPEVAKETGATRIMLLQGIITARILNGEWRSAYEAFDLVLRLYPTATPSRIYELFIYERPVREGFIVFLMACRAGTPPRPGVLTPLLKEIWTMHRDVSAMIRLVWAYVGAGGRVTFHHLNLLIQGIFMSYPINPRDGSRKAIIEHENGLKTLFAYVRECVAAFRNLGVELAAATFNTLMSCGGKLKRGDIVLGGLRDMITMGIQPNAITYRTLVLVAGDLGDVHQLEEAWSLLCAAREEEYNAARSAPRALPRLPGDTHGWDIKDFKSLIDACCQTDHITFAGKEIDAKQQEMGLMMYSDCWRHFAHAQAQVRNARRLAGENAQQSGRGGKPEGTIGLLSTKFHEGDYSDHPDPRNPDHKQNTYSLPDELSPELKRLLQVFTSSTVISFCPQDPNHVPIDLDLSAPPFPPLPNDKLREIYDELVLAPHTAVWGRRLPGQSIRFDEPPDEDTDTSSGSTTITGYTLRELRFQNWIAVNKLLFEAEVHERRIQERMRREASGISLSNALKNITTGCADKNVFPITDQGYRSGLRYHFWKEETIRERVRRTKELRTREMMMDREEGEVDINIRTGRIKVKKPKGRATKARTQCTKSGETEIVPQGKAEERAIRSILGGGGIAFVNEEGGVGDVRPEMFTPPVKIDKDKVQKRLKGMGGMARESGVLSSVEPVVSRSVKETDTEVPTQEPSLPSHSAADTTPDTAFALLDAAPPAEPAPMEPAPTEPAPTEPVPTEPVPTESVPTEPVPTEPVPTEPVPTEPVPMEPVPTEPVPTEPVPTEPVPTEPVPTEPVPTEPVPTEPVPTESVPTEPVPMGPEPTEPASMEQTPVDLMAPVRAETPTESVTVPPIALEISSPPSTIPELPTATPSLAPSPPSTTPILVSDTTTNSTPNPPSPDPLLLSPPKPETVIETVPNESENVQENFQENKSSEATVEAPKTVEEVGPETVIETVPNELENVQENIQENTDFEATVEAPKTVGEVGPETVTETIVNEPENAHENAQENKDSEAIVDAPQTVEEIRPETVTETVPNGPENVQENVQENRDSEATVEAPKAIKEVGPKEAGEPVTEVQSEATVDRPQSVEDVKPEGPVEEKVKGDVVENETDREIITDELRTVEISEIEMAQASLPPVPEVLETLSEAVTQPAKEYKRLSSIARALDAPENTPMQGQASENISKAPSIAEATSAVEDKQLAATEARPSQEVTYESSSATDASLAAAELTKTPQAPIAEPASPAAEASKISQPGKSKQGTKRTKKTKSSTGKPLKKNTAPEPLPAAEGTGPPLIQTPQYTNTLPPPLISGAPENPQRADTLSPPEEHAASFKPEATLPLDTESKPEPQSTAQNIEEHGAVIKLDATHAPDTVPKLEPQSTAQSIEEHGALVKQPEPQSAAQTTSATPTPTTPTSTDNQPMPAPSTKTQPAPTPTPELNFQHPSPPTTSPVLALVPSTASLLSATSMSETAKPTVASPSSPPPSHSVSPSANSKTLQTEKDKKKKLKQTGKKKVKEQEDHKEKEDENSESESDSGSSGDENAGEKGKKALQKRPKRGKKKK